MEGVMQVLAQQRVILCVIVVWLAGFGREAAACEYEPASAAQFRLENTIKLPLAEKKWSVPDDFFKLKQKKQARWSFFRRPYAYVDVVVVPWLSSQQGNLIRLYAVPVINKPGGCFYFVESKTSSHREAVFELELDTELLSRKTIDRAFFFYAFVELDKANQDGALTLRAEDKTPKAHLDTVTSADVRFKAELSPPQTETFYAALGRWGGGSEGDRLYFRLREAKREKREDGVQEAKPSASVNASGEPAPPVKSAQLAFKLTATPESIIKLYSGRDMFKYGDVKIDGSKLGADLEANKSVQTITTLDRELLIKRVASSAPSRFATRTDEHSVKLDYAKLNAATKGSIELALVRRLPEGFRFVPGVRVGGKDAPYPLKCGFTIEGAGGRKTGRLERRTGADGVKAVVLNESVEGEPLTLTADCEKDGARKIALTPDALNTKFAGNGAPVVNLQIPVNRLYAGLAPGPDGDLANDSPAVWSDVLKFVHDLHKKLNEANKVRSAVVVMENRVMDKDAVVSPGDADVLTADFPPQNQFQTLATKTFAAKSAGSGGIVQNALARLKEPAFQDVTHVVEVTTASLSCKATADQVQAGLEGLPKPNNLRVSIVVGAKGPLIKDDGANMIALKRGDGGPGTQPAAGGEIYKCKGLPDTVDVYVFDGEEALQAQDGWAKNLEIISSSITVSWWR
jgi:hypothetical protein